MAILKFKKFEDVDKLEREGKGINWHFNPDKAYLNKALKIHIKVPFAPGVYKFKTFEEAETWEIGVWVKNGAAKRISKIV